MIQRVKPWTRWGARLAVSQSGSGVVGSHQEASGTGSFAVSLVPAMSGNGTAALPGEDDLVHGQEFTLTGSGFGTRDNYGPSGRLNWKQLRFDSGTLTEDGFTFNSGGSTHWQLMTTGNRHARSVGWAKRYNAGNIQYLRAEASFPGRFFASIWHFNSNSVNGKTIRFWSNGGSTDFWTNMGPASANVASDSPNQFVDFGAFASPKNQWIRLDYFMQSNVSPWVRIWRVGTNSNNPIYTRAGSTNMGSSINPALGAGEDSNSSSIFWGFDDVYMDFTPARVELGNADTWAACTLSEIQTPISWSDGQIVFRGNAGAFTSGQTGYLYVVRDDLGIVGPVRSVQIA